MRPWVLGVGCWVLGVGLGSPAVGQEDVADVPSSAMQAGSDANRRFFLIGPKAGVKSPADGFHLLLVLPGGDGSADFNPFVRRILKFGLPDSYLIAQLVAPKWSNDPNRIVWPTKTNPVPEMKFSTEEFIQSVLETVKKSQKIDPKHIYTLGWSSGGTPCYAASLTPGIGITGTFVAMSVFQPRFLPPLEKAKGHAYFLLHSPQDFIPIRQAQDAKDQLGAAGARTELRTYDGGHGWRGDVFGNIEAGVTWLEKKPATTAAPAVQPLQPAVLNLPVNQAEWERQFTAIKGAEQAESLARKLANAPPGSSMDLFLACWEKIPAESDRQAFLRAFRPAVKLSELDSIHLQILDHSLDLQKQAFWRLTRYSFRDFSEDYVAYLQWYRHYRTRLVEDVIEENVEALFKGMNRATGDELLRRARYVNRVDSIIRDSPITQQTAIRAGALKLAASWMTDPEDRRTLLDAGERLLTVLMPDESFLRKEIVPLAELGGKEQRYRAVRVIGQRQNKWAANLLIDMLDRSMRQMKNGELDPCCSTIASCLGELGEPRAIPYIIGMIDSDNTYDTIYGAGYFCLSFLIGVNYDETHNGPWWRAWWDKNKSRFSPEVQKMAIPDYPKTKNWTKPTAADTSRVLANSPTVTELLDEFVRRAADGKLDALSHLAQQIAGFNDPAAIPTLIAAIPLHDRMKYDVGYFGLTFLVGVNYDESHDGKWWATWWDRNRARFPETVRKMEIPRLASKWFSCLGLTRLSQHDGAGCYFVSSFIRI